MLLELIDGIIQFHRVAGVVEPQYRAVADAKSAKCLRDTGEARIAERVALGEHRDLPRLQLADFQEIAYRRVGLFRVAWPVIEDVPVRRIMPHHVGAGERSEEQRPSFERKRQRDRCRRRPVVADVAEHLLLFPEILHGVERPRRLKAVVGRNQLEQPAVHASGGVRPGERDVDSELHVIAVFLRASGIRNDDPEADLAIGDAMHIARRKRLGWRRRGDGRGGGDRGSQ